MNPAGQYLEGCIATSTTAISTPTYPLRIRTSRCVSRSNIDKSTATRNRNRERARNKNREMDIWTSELHSRLRLKLLKFAPEVSPVFPLIKVRFIWENSVLGALQYDLVCVTHVPEMWRSDDQMRWDQKRIYSPIAKKNINK